MNFPQTMQFWITVAVSLLMVGVSGHEAVLNDTCGACEITCKLLS